MNSKFVSVFLSFATAIYNLFLFLCSWRQHFRWPLVKSIFFSIERMRIWNCLCAINNHNKPIYLVNLPLVCIFLRTPTIVENWPIFFLLSLSHVSIWIKMIPLVQGEPRNQSIFTNNTTFQLLNWFFLPFSWVKWCAYWN